MSSNYRNRSSKKPKPRTRPVNTEQRTDPPPKPLESYQRENRHPSGTYWDKIKSNVISAHNGICYLCDHPGAKQVDHLIQYAETQDNSLPNLRPAHGSSGLYQKNPCPVCGLNCNQLRGNLSVEAGRKKIAKRMAENGFVVQTPDDGRDW